MGYYFASGRCHGCDRLFTFNPHLVPSVRAGEAGLRKPIRASCVELANPLREERGLEPIRPLPGAYEPASEADEPC